MKTYPTITGQRIIGLKDAYVFDKIDGSNVRVEWSKKRGFYKFGSRHRLISPDEKPLGETYAVFDRDVKGPLNARLIELNEERVVCFFEFHGQNSAFGFHVDEPHEMALIDVSRYKHGIVEPLRFCEMFAGVHVPKARLLHVGDVGEDLIESVQDGTLQHMGPEGVVIKAGFDRKLGSPTMFKVKRRTWYERLRERCAGDQAMFDRLA
jgi:hypothetical protein